MDDRENAGDAVLEWEDKEISLGPVKPLASHWWGIPETAEGGDEVAKRSGVERLICDLSIKLLIYCLVSVFIMCMLEQQQQQKKSKNIDGD